MSGSVNPDRFVLDADTGAAVEVTVGDKRTAVRSVAGGGTRTVDTDASARALPDRRPAPLPRPGWPPP